MAIAHFEILPTLSLQLAVVIEHDRCEMRALVQRPDDERARQAVGVALDAAKPLAFGVPVLWPAWGNLMVCHAMFTQHRLRDACPERLQREWRDVEACAEELARRSVHWALHEQSHHRVARVVAMAFEMWEQARQQAYALEQLAGKTPPQRLAESCRFADSLFGLAITALNDQDEPAEAPGAYEAGTPGEERQRLLEYESLHDQWRIAEEEAADAELAIVDMQFRGIPVTSEQRVRAVQLRDAARSRREAFLRTGEL